MKTLLCSTLALLVLVLLNLGQTPAVARETSAPGQSLTPLESLLQPDGTLDLQTGFSGSLDPTGWTLVSEPGQSPRFVRSGSSGESVIIPAAVPGDVNWDPNFGVAGADNTSSVLAIAVNGSDVYVGGSFSLAGNLPVSNIVRRSGNA